MIFNAILILSFVQPVLVVVLGLVFGGDIGLRDAVLSGLLVVPLAMCVVGFAALG